jgi:hypothetical protein
VQITSILRTKERWNNINAKLDFAFSPPKDHKDSAQKYNTTIRAPTAFAQCLWDRSIDRSRSCSFSLEGHKSQKPKSPFSPGARIPHIPICHPSRSKNVHPFFFLHGEPFTHPFGPRYPTGKGSLVATLLCTTIAVNFV